MSSPKINYRKRSDFDNRIKFINSVKADMFISIHLNYYNDPSYGGIQVFYDDVNEENIKIAKLFQNTLNNNRQCKKINTLYLFKNISIPGILLEVGFISNNQDRLNLQDKTYQIEFGQKINKILNQYFT